MLRRPRMGCLRRNCIDCSIWIQCHDCEGIVQNDIRSPVRSTCTSFSFNQSASLYPSNRRSPGSTRKNEILRPRHSCTLQRCLCCSFFAGAMVGPNSSTSRYTAVPVSIEIVRCPFSSSSSVWLMRHKSVLLPEPTTNGYP